jgi:hypothetical protein
MLKFAFAKPATWLVGLQWSQTLGDVLLGALDAAANAYGSPPPQYEVMRRMGSRANAPSDRRKVEDSRLATGQVSRNQLEMFFCHDEPPRPEI